MGGLKVIAKSGWFAARPSGTENVYKIYAESWPTASLPEVMGGGTATLGALVCEFLFISLFRACAESLASENASRLSAMQCADRNIDELLAELYGTFHRLRQSGGAYWIAAAKMLRMNQAAVIAGLLATAVRDVNGFGKVQA